MNAHLHERLEIIDLYAEYAACLDDQRLEEWPTFFVDDCCYQLIPRENFDRGYPLATISLESKRMLEDRVYGVKETLFFAPYYQRHIIGVPRITARNGDIISVEANYAVLRTKRNELSEVLNTGRYVDKLARTSEGLRFLEKRCVFDSEMIPNSIILPI